MKPNKIVLSLVVALAAVLATTGCKHKSDPKLTNLPKHSGGPIGTGNNEHPETISSTQPVDFGQQAPVATQTGPISTATFDLVDYTQDPGALAAYTVHFGFDSTVVADNEQVNLASVGQALTSDPAAKLLIEGHCDERGTEEYNRALGERRALALREALNHLGVDAMRVKTISYGKDKPADVAHDETAWAKNRRGEFILLHPKSVPLANASF